MMLSPTPPGSRSEILLGQNVYFYTSFIHANNAMMSRQLNFEGPVPTLKNTNDKSRSSGDSEKGMWSSMLDSVASGKKLPEKNLIVLG